MVTDIVLKAKKLGINRIYVFSHKYPDGDAKGSSLALVEFFKTFGLISKYVITEESKYLNNIFGTIEITTSLEDERFIAVICDCSNESICENDLWKKAEVTYKIDHHLGSVEFADYNFINSSASSTCEVVWEKIGKGFITEAIATYLYTGIYTDTGRFEYSISENVFLACADLLKRGANTDLVTREVKKIGYYKSKMMGYILSNYTKYAEGIIGVVVTSRECIKNKFSAISLAKSVNTLKDVSFAEVFFVAAQDTDGSVYVELRSAQYTNINVCDIAKEFGGGGHFHASGCVLKNFGEIAKFIDKIRVM